MSLLIIAGGALLASDDVRFETKLDSNNYLIGDLITLELSAVVPEDGSTVWPEVADTMLGMELISRSDISEDIRDGLVYLNQEMVFMYFDSGTFIFPPLPFEYMEPSGDGSKLIESAAIPFSVNYAEIDSTAAPRPIKDRIEVTYRPIGKYVLFGGLALLALGLIYLAVARARKVEAVAPAPVARPKPTLPPYEQAMKRLRELEEKKLWQQDQQKQYHIELTEILREYIEGRFGYHTLEQTTPEILANFDGKQELHGGGQSHKDNLTALKEILERADMVKFAKARLMPDEHQGSIFSAKAFVERTRKITQLTTE